MMSKACQKEIQTLKNKKRLAITSRNKSEGLPDGG
ncbi:hypothetical protein STM14_4886 [Salmonella enterica subsp. enterica serovar Typhimurium str. 14028S]|uniref:Uncharacterized protein n=2 Tax=Salmonella enterica I TaxID=59201 RepID=A0A0F6B9P1_SALT1|nr:hypothetical protein SPAB_05035 [Salmonella enterica subsp. enterica serovar Paratyphi B str. SPB7]ACY91243.1 hypothetical protein STM14_4886 [Salmonella enterica subsp. enterica serovar Typhimurium str. 14028S]